MERLIAMLCRVDVAYIVVLTANISKTDLRVHAWFALFVGCFFSLYFAFLMLISDLFNYC